MKYRVILGELTTNLTPENADFVYEFECKDLEYVRDRANSILWKHDWTCADTNSFIQRWVDTLDGGKWEDTAL